MVNVNWISFTIASIALVLAPGPGSVFVAKTSASRGIQAGHFAMLGIMLGDISLILFSFLGVSALLLGHPTLFRAIRLAGAGYLILLGTLSFINNKNSISREYAPSILPFRQAILITLLNPKAVLFFMAFFPVFIQSRKGGLALPYSLMTIAFTAISFMYLYSLSVASSRIGMAFRKYQTLQSIAQKVCGLIFIGFGIKVALSAR